VEEERPTAMPAPLRRLAEHLATAQDMADSAQYSMAFGYLEQAVKLALDYFREQEAIRPCVEAIEREGERHDESDAADVWRGVVSHPLF
jgi:hypothetical protein